MKVKDFLFSFREMSIKPRVTCKDGFSVSIQNSSNHHCNNNSVELGFPNQYEESLEKFAEDSNTTETVFDYVPLEIVEQLISKHGEIVKINLENIYE